MVRRRPLHRSVLAAALLGLLAAAGGNASAQGGSTTPPAADEQEVLFKADVMEHERELGLIVARGNVEMAQGQRILRADVVSYNQKEDVVTATGNVVLLEPTGEVVFADHVELTGDFKSGIVENIRILLSDNARLAAVGGRRVGGTVTEMQKAVYSPCPICKSGQPLWRVKAARVIHDKTAQEVEYRDAVMEFAGVPVFYTPYLSHPDPTVKRRSGILPPRFGNDSNLGFVLEVPYYYAISPDKDATFRPIITTDEGPVLAGEYRQRFAHGLFETEGSATYGSQVDGDEKFRGHFYADARFDLDRTWRTGADVRLVSDDTYLQRYDFDSTDTLTNHVYLEGFREDSYASAQAYYWRGLRAEDDPGTMPIVAPMLDFNAVGEPGVAGGRWQFDANAMVLTRTDGTDSRRLSLKTGWELPHIADTGEVYHLYAEVQTDAYFVNDVDRPDRAAGDTYSGFEGRAFPRVGLDWRYPFARSSGTLTQVIEPVAGVMIAPNGGNPDEIPNEDSQDFEFDDTNLLSRNRFTGLDRVEGGQRVYYGLQMAIFGKNGYSSAFVGQSYRLRRDTTFDARSGLEDNFSDVVGRLDIRPSGPIGLQYRFRVDKDGFSPKRHELLGSLGPPALNLTVDYGFFDESTGSGEFADREEITVGLNSQVTPEWRVGVSTRRDLEASDSLRHQAFIEYDDIDCFALRFDFQRTFTQDRDVKPSNSFFVRVTFKTLGSVETEP